ncbi:MAG: maltose alpha-D-glucosyltransferase [Hyphomicrobiaceae bacterium]|nr:maltose alpha-D-glucosyltransferase [Hyphomicrobiaceae bacterium]
MTTIELSSRALSSGDAFATFDPPKPQIDRGSSDWYKDAVIYQLHIKAFSDANNDGIGDFAGLMSQLDYVQQLGVTAIWLLPFYPSPLRDDGYDIADYTAVNESYGSMDDFRRFVEAAHERGIRVITELVINHTSDAHPWFQRARRAPVGSPERDFYVWSDTEDLYQGTRIIFIDTETSNWTWDPVAKAYFWHRFYSHQPDLNFENPQVFEEVVKAMRFWLDMGVDGLRLDAVPYLCERDGTNNENLPETHEVLRRIRAEIDRSYPDRMLLAEANQWPEDTRPYFGDGDECHMAFHFPLMPRMYMALAQEDRHPVTDILRQTPELPEGCQWALFLRNHDELTLEMVTAEERDYLWRTYAVDPRARINLGIRRRLSALMDNDRRKIELMNVLLLSMPGTPVLYYGDEIGMGDNYYLGDREGVRTPMQWSVDRNAGFSRADPQRLYLPVLMDPVYGYQAVNVESQQTDHSSLLNWTRRMIGVRKSHAAFGRGSLTFLYPRNRRVIAFLREYEDERILCVANLSRSAQAVELDLQDFRGAVPIELMDGSAFPPITGAPYVLTLPAYGYFWFVLAAEAELPKWHVPTPEPLPRLVTLVMNDGWKSILSGREGRHLERDILKHFLQRQRWFSGKNTDIANIDIKLVGGLGADAADHVIATLGVTFTNGETQQCLMPLSLLSEPHEITNDAAQRPYALAMVRRGPRMAMLIDAAHNDTFSKLLVEKLRKGETLASETGEIRLIATPALADCAAKDDSVKMVGAEQSNVSVVVGDSVVLKFYRNLDVGTQPEVEVGKFLGEVGFAGTPRFLGAVECSSGSEGSKTLASAFEYISNQGDAWGVVTNTLERTLESYGLAGEGEDVPEFAFPLDVGAKLGLRTAEMHKALATPTSNEAFAAEPVTPADIARWVDEARTETARAFAALEATPPDAMPESTRGCVRLMQSHKADIDRLLLDSAALKPSGAKTRLHGDYHLGQVLVVQDDLMIIDFEGEPKRTLQQRRAKSSPLADVAGMLRSFDYAAWAALDKNNERGMIAPERARVIALAWRDRATTDFVAAYTAAMRGSAGHPDDAETASGLLNLFLLRKALYEVQYELGSRPAWLSIPVRGVISLLDKIKETA